MNVEIPVSFCTIWNNLPIIFKIIIFKKKLNNYEDMSYSNIPKFICIETFEAGQNIAIQLASDGYDSSVTKLVTMWYDEVEDFDPQNVHHYV